MLFLIRSGQIKWLVLQWITSAYCFPNLPVFWVWLMIPENQIYIILTTFYEPIKFRLNQHLYRCKYICMDIYIFSIIVNFRLSMVLKNSKRSLESPEKVLTFSWTSAARTMSRSEIFTIRIVYISHFKLFKFNVM